MRLNPASFDAWLGGNIGQNFLWFKSYACPCININSGAANKNCKLCTGRGRQWNPGIPAVAGVASQNVQQRWAQFGLWQEGDTILSIPQISPMYAMGEFDRVTALNADEPFSLNKTRGMDDLLDLKLIDITRVFWMNSTLTATIEGGIPVQDANYQLTWPNNDGPPIGTTYSISGHNYLEYYCFMDDPNSRNEHFGARLPRKTVARRWDLFGR